MELNQNQKCTCIILIQPAFVVKIKFFTLILSFLLCQTLGLSQSVWNSKNSNLNSIRSLGFTPESVVGACDCGESGTIVKTWSLSEGYADTLFRSRLREIHISNNGAYIAVRTFKDSILLQIFSMEKRKWLWQSKGTHYDAIAFSENDQYLVAVNQIVLEKFDVNTGTKTQTKNPIEGELAEYVENKKRVVKQKLSPSGRYLVIWNNASHHEWGDFWLCLISPFSSPPNTNIAVWDILENKLVSEIQKPSSGIVSVVFSPDGRTVFLVCGDKKIRTWSLAENRIIKEFDGSYMDISARDDLLVVVEGHLRILNYLTFKLMKDFGRVGDKVGRLSEWSFSSDGKYFALEVEGILYLYETDTWEVLWSIPSCP